MWACSSVVATAGEDRERHGAGARAARTAAPGYRVIPMGTGDGTGPAVGDEPGETSAAETTADGTSAAEVEVRRERARRPLVAVAGGYGQPTAPLVLALPVGAWATSVVFDLASHAANEEVVYARAAFWLIGVGLVGAVAAGVPLVLDALLLARRTPVRRLATSGLVALGVAVVAFGASFLLRRGLTSFEATPPGPFALSVVGLAAIVVVGVVQARLGHRYGVRVADEATQRRGYEPIGGATPQTNAEPAERAPG